MELNNLDDLVKALISREDVCRFYSISPYRAKKKDTTILKNPLLWAISF